VRGPARSRPSRSYSQLLTRRVADCHRGRRPHQGWNALIDHPGKSKRSGKKKRAFSAAAEIVGGTARRFPHTGEGAIEAARWRASTAKRAVFGSGNRLRSRDGSGLRMFAETAASARLAHQGSAASQRLPIDIFLCSAGAHPRRCCCSISKGTRPRPVRDARRLSPFLKLLQGFFPTVVSSIARSLPRLGSSGQFPIKRLTPIHHGLVQAGLHPSGSGFADFQAPTILQNPRRHRTAVIRTTPAHIQNRSWKDSFIEVWLDSNRRQPASRSHFRRAYAAGTYRYYKSGDLSLSAVSSHCELVFQQRRLSEQPT